MHLARSLVAGVQAKHPLERMTSFPSLLPPVAFSIIFRQFLNDLHFGVTDVAQRARSGRPTSHPESRSPQQRPPSVWKLHMPQLLLLSDAASRHRNNKKRWASTPFPSGIHRDQSCGGQESWSKVHCLGDLSGRHRKSLVPCLNRSLVTWSYRTSTTRSGLTGCQSPERSVLHRLGPPGARPENPGGAWIASSFLVRAARSELAMVEVKPTWLSNPFSSKRPKSSEPTSALSLRYRNPPTTQSALRNRLTLTIALSPGR